MKSLDVRIFLLNYILDRVPEEYRQKFSLEVICNFGNHNITLDIDADFSLESAKDMFIENLMNGISELWNNRSDFNKPEINIIWS